MQIKKEWPKDRRKRATRSENRPEQKEWGNPNDEEYYHYMRSYSPYDNTTAQKYPHILITAGLNDPRIQYWEPAK